MVFEHVCLSYFSVSAPCICHYPVCILISSLSFGHISYVILLFFIFIFHSGSFAEMFINVQYPCQRKQKIKKKSPDPNSCSVGGSKAFFRLTVKRQSELKQKMKKHGTFCRMSFGRTFFNVARYEMIVTESDSQMC